MGCFLFHATAAGHGLVGRCWCSGEVCPQNGSLQSLIVDIIIIII